MTTTHRHFGDSFIWEGLYLILFLPLGRKLKTTCGNNVKPLSRCPATQK